MTALLRSYAFTNVRVCNRDGSGAVSFDIKALQLGFDRSWSPYCQATITTGALQAFQVTALEPRNGMRIRFTIKETDASGAVYSTDYDLGLRSRVQSWATGELRLTAASDEALAQDYGYLTAQLPNAMPIGPGSGAYFAADVAAGAIVGAISTAAVPMVSGAPNITVTGADEAACDVGQSAWDWASAMAEAAGAWIYCDEAAAWRWAPPGWAATTSTFQATDTDLIIDVEDTVSRDDPAFGNALVIAYTRKSTGPEYLTSSAGIEPRKTITLTRNRYKPANGSAAGARSQAQLHGRSIVVTAAADIRARPNQSWKATWLGNTATGAVQSVAFDFPAGTMRLAINI